MKNYLLFILMLSTVLFGQDDYKKWLQKENASYQKYFSEEDKSFIEFLKKEWKKFNIEDEIEFTSEPKPIKLPVFKYKDEPVNPVIKEPEVITIPEAEQNEPELPMEDEPAEVDPLVDEPVINEPEFTDLPAIEDNINIDFNYLNEDLRVTSKTDFGYELASKPDKKLIAKFWGDFCRQNSELFIKKLNKIKNRKSLNDWGYFLLVYSTAESLYPDNFNLRQLFTWFIINKSGYQANVGIVGQKILLFIPSKHQIFRIPFFSDSKGNKLYAVNFENLEGEIIGDVLTYDGNYSSENKVLDLSIQKPIKLNLNYLKKILSFEYQNRKYNITVFYNSSNVDFYNKYPRVNLPIYFTSATDNVTKNSLIKSFEILLKDKPIDEALNILLRFSQTAFEYKTDQENFNREKPLFIEETVFYKYSDCEDRSILFANLVSDILDLKVVGLDYPGHISTAVLTNADIEGDKIIIEGQEYLICDPTYINAPIGKAMDSYKDQQPDAIIKIKKQ